ncbi:hypothetical protein ACELLULO517_15595 [Acidisoma cellulosilytica]|uniref:Uncharacterized protein n=1 Tax=Acidisoma cellulosilyticum TaxID=2802395 RepID=A0A964E4P0_9PROT|nr:hypothetical protein [Acidisoma cellulosilyticum]MCB8881671.1 hypothetical protein [Acidisoma cellulosilyticum]
MTKFEVFANNNSYGIFQADTEALAIDAAMVDAGYKNVDDMLAQTGSSESKFTAKEIPGFIIVSRGEIWNRINVACDIAIQKAIAERKAAEAEAIEEEEPLDTIAFSFNLVYEGQGEFVAQAEFRENYDYTILLNYTSVGSDIGRDLVAAVNGDLDAISKLTDGYEWSDWSDNNSWNDEDLADVLANGYSNKIVNEDEDEEIVSI